MEQYIREELILADFSLIVQSIDKLFRIVYI